MMIFIYFFYMCQHETNSVSFWAHVLSLRFFLSPDSGVNVVTGTATGHVTLLKGFFLFYISNNLTKLGQKLCLVLQEKF